MGAGAGRRTVDLTGVVRQAASRFAGLPVVAKLAVALVAAVAMATAARLLGSTAWLWASLAGSGFLAAYGRLGDRALLLLGAALAGSGAGILFEAVAGWDGAYLMSLGAALAMADALAPARGHLPLVVGVALAGIGTVVAIASSDLVTLMVLAGLVAAMAALLGPRRT